jgi:hypothetical protein
MKNKLLLAAFCSLFVLSCDKSDDVKPKPVTYFELSVGATYPTQNSDDWIIIHDANGVLLSVKQFESGQNITFDSTITPPEKLSITFLKAALDSDQDRYNFTSFLGIAPTEKWTLDLKTSFYDPGAEIGQLSVQVNDENIGSQWDTQVSSEYGGSTFGSLANLSTLVFNRTVYSNANDVFLFLTDKDRTPRYKFVENAIPGSFAYSLADFKTFDKLVNFSFPPTNGWLLFVSGSEKSAEEYAGNASYAVNFYLSGYSADTFSRSTMPAAYLDRFSTYFTGLYLTYADYSLSYQSFGPVPDPVTLQKDDITAALTNKNITAYSISSSDFAWRETDWRASYQADGKYRYITWLTTSGNADTSNPTMPAVIAQKYPAINMQEVGHNGTTFYKGNRSYADIINEKFKGGVPKPYSVKGKTLY